MFEYAQALQATANAKAWYKQLTRDIMSGKYRLHHDYNGFMVVSIFDAKPYAYRAKSVLEFHIVDQPPTPIPARLSGPVLEGYFNAVVAEKEAWSIFRAAYCNKVINWLKNPDDSLVPTGGETLSITATYRRWEVKKC